MEKISIIYITCIPAIINYLYIICTIQAEGLFA